MPDPAKLLLDTLRLDEHRFRLQRCFNCQHLIQVRRLVSDAPGSRFIQLRLLRNPSNVPGNQVSSPAQGLNAITEVGTKEEERFQRVRE